MRSRNLITLLFATVILTGCSGGTPASYYLIEPVATPGVEVEGTLSLEIVDLEIPQYLERFQIASRRPDSQLVFASSHQWAESLRKNLTRTLARNLINNLQTAAIGTPSNRLGSPPDFRLSVYIEQFERGADGHVVLLARWQLIHRESHQTLVNSSNEYVSEHRISSQDFAGTVKAMSELLGEFSRTIASRVEQNQ